MSRKKSKNKPEASKFSRLLGTTVTVALVFSAGLITGQRLVNQDNVPPLVSLSVTNEAQAAAPKEIENVVKPLKTTFSFYDELTKPVAKQPGVIVAAPGPQGKKPKAAAAPKEPVKVEAPAEAKAEVQKPEPEPAIAQEPVAPEPTEAPKVVEEKPEPKKAAVPTVAESVPAKVPESAAPAEPLPARYALQVGSHPSKAAATRELSRLRAMGLEAHVITVKVPEKGRFYRVRVGKFHSMEEVRGFQAELAEKRGIDGFITPL